MRMNLITAIACAILGGAAMSAVADDSHHPKAEAQKSYAVKGAVVAVDKAASRVQLKHEPVPELKWPAMTMFFNVADKSQLDTLKLGDPVEFSFVPQNGRAPLITQIKTVK